MFKILKKWVNHRVYFHISCIKESFIEGLSQNAICGVSFSKKYPHIRSVCSGIFSPKALPITFCDSPIETIEILFIDDHCSVDIHRVIQFTNYQIMISVNDEESLKLITIFVED